MLPLLSPLVRLRGGCHEIGVFLWKSIKRYIGFNPFFTPGCQLLNVFFRWFLYGFYHGKSACFSTTIWENMFWNFFPRIEHANLSCSPTRMTWNMFRWQEIPNLKHSFGTGLLVGKERHKQTSSKVLNGQTSLKMRKNDLFRSFTPFEVELQMFTFWGLKYPY